MGIWLARPEVAPKTPVASRLREARKRLGETDRDEWARAIGVGKSTLASYERGESEPTASVLSAYRENFGISVLWIVTGEGEMLENPANAPKKPILFEASIMKKLGRIVVRLHRDAKIRLLPEDVPVEAAELYNELHQRVTDITDTNEVQAVFPQLEVLLKKRLAAAAVEPGTGKRSAS